MFKSLEYKTSRVIEVTSECHLMGLTVDTSMMNSPVDKLTRLRTTKQKSLSYTANLNNFITH